MNDYKQIKSIILGRFFRKMTAAGLVCLAVLLVCLFAGKFFFEHFYLVWDRGILSAAALDF